MTDFDALLRETLHDRAQAMPIAPDAVGAIAIRARRLRRRRQAGMAGGVSAVVAAVLLMAAALVHPGNRDGGGPEAVSPAMKRISVHGLHGRSEGPVLLNGSVYLVTSDDNVARVDPATGKVIAYARSGMSPPGQPLPIEFGSSAPDLFVSGGGLWLLGWGPDKHFHLDRLDPTTLRSVRRLPLAGMDLSSLTATPFSIWTVAGPTDILMLNGTTGEVVRHLSLAGDLPPHLARESLDLVSVDEQARVAWLSGQVDKQISVLMPARIDADRLTVTGFTMVGKTSLGQLAPGAEGSLWVVNGRSVSHLAPQAQGLGLKRLPTGPFLSRTGTTVPQLTATGTRLWAAVPGPGPAPTSLLCLDPATGEELARYPIPDAIGADSLQLSGDAHQIYLQPARDLLRIHGPDHCLT